MDIEDTGTDVMPEVDLEQETEIEQDDDPRLAVADNVTDPVSLYFNRMGREPLLTREEEVELAKKIERGREAKQQLARSQGSEGVAASPQLRQLVAEGEAARDKFIRANTRLVVNIAKKYRNKGMPFSDLIQAGNLGLIKAVDKFEYQQGNKFSTYATWWIRQSITRSLTQQSRTIRIPDHLSNRIRKVHQAARTLEQSLGRQPRPSEIAHQMGLTQERVERLLRISRRPLSLNRPVNREDEQSELGSFIEDQNTPPPSERAAQHLLKEDLEVLLNELEPREARILRLRFGLQDNRTYTLEELGEKFGVSRERIRQIERKALRKLRNPMYRRRLRDYLK
ncbi:MAG: sigma-70 family RNA polymerase sigma factor [Chloroflexi bacterium]|nr:sigma-70 family RNA polymerase sigma factor [Chloroflexota bacterium]